MLPLNLTAQTDISTPLGTMRLARSAHGLVGAWFEGQRWHPGALDTPQSADDPLLLEARTQLQRYFRGQIRDFDLPLDLRSGTPFQRTVWEALRRINANTTCSYSALAASVGRPTAVRAVGAAIGRNPLSVIIPCHRILGASGALTGYAGGLARKQALLNLESPARSMPQPHPVRTGGSHDRDRSPALSA